MKVLVVSDSYGDREILVELADRYQEEVDALIHCGDSELLADDVIWQRLTAVKGNMDFDSTFPKERIEEVAGERIFWTHGHLYNVNFSIEPLIKAAEQADARFAFFGHTHQLGVEQWGNLFLLNPGSILEPRGRYNIQTYALVQSDEKEVKVTYFDRLHQPVESLTRIFEK